MKPGSAAIHIVALDGTMPPEISYLTAEERDRAAAFRFPEDATRWTAARNALRRILGETIGIAPEAVPLVLTEFGKPELAGPYGSWFFSLSHCSDLALIAVCRDGPVGVDIEAISRAPELQGCEKTFCHPLEEEELPTDTSARSLRLLELWTAKEALLKAVGTGFSHPPEKVRILSNEAGSTATSDLPLPAISTLLIHRLGHPALSSHSAALAAPASVVSIGFHLCETSTSPARSVITRPPTV